MVGFWRRGPGRSGFAWTWPVRFVSQICTICTESCVWQLSPEYLERMSKGRQAHSNFFSLSSLVFFSTGFIWVLRNIRFSITVTTTTTTTTTTVKGAATYRIPPSASLATRVCDVFEHEAIGRFESIPARRGCANHPLLARWAHALWITVLNPRIAPLAHPTHSAGQDHLGNVSQQSLLPHGSFPPSVDEKFRIKIYENGNGGHQHKHYIQFLSFRWHKILIWDISFDWKWGLCHGGAAVTELCAWLRLFKSLHT